MMKMIVIHLLCCCELSLLIFVMGFTCCHCCRLIRYDSIRYDSVHIDLFIVIIYYTNHGHCLILSLITSSVVFILVTSQSVDLILFQYVLFLIVVVVDSIRYDCCCCTIITCVTIYYSNHGHCLITSPLLLYS
jgi:hypothetical protein